MLLYTVLRGTEKAAMLADPSLTNKHLIQDFFGGMEGISIVRHGYENHFYQKFCIT